MLQKGTPAERQTLELAEKQIKESLTHTYAEYLLSIENTYSMISYIHHFPGIVHFILAERTEQRFAFSSESILTSARVHAPNIVSLFGPDSPLIHDKTVTKNAMNLLKRKVWDLCYQSQEFLARGMPLSNCP